MCCVKHGLHTSQSCISLTVAVVYNRLLMCRYCSSSFFNASTEVPAVLEGPSLTVTLTTGTCAIVKNSTKGSGLSDLLEDSLTCIGPELSYTKVHTHPWVLLCSGRS